MKCRKKLKSLTTPSQNLRLKAFPRIFEWRISANFEGLDTLLKSVNAELGDKYYALCFSHSSLPFSCLDSHAYSHATHFSCSSLPHARFYTESRVLDSDINPPAPQLSFDPPSHFYRKSPLAFHRDFMDKLESFIFESVGNIIEHRLLRLTKSQVYGGRLTYRQRVDSAQILKIELAFTPCRVKLVVSYPSRTFYFAPLKAKRYFERYLEYLRNRGGSSDVGGLRASRDVGSYGGYGESIMRHSFHSLQRHRVLSARSIFILR